MKSKLKLLSFFCLAAITGLFTACENSGEDGVFETLEQQNALLLKYDFQAIPNQYVVRLKEGTLGSQPAAKGAGSYKTAMESNKTQLLSMFGKSNLAADNIKRVYGYAIEGFAAVLNEEQLQDLGSDPRVRSIEQDYLIILAPPPGKGPNRGGDDGGGGPSAQETPYGITRVTGGADYTGSNVAWVLDSGIDLDHEDLNVDASRGITVFTKGKDGNSPNDGNGHGTHVAGTIAALNNSLGVVGVAAGATVIPVKVLDSRGSGSYSGVIAGVDFVGANGSNGDVANMSLGGPVSSSLDAAVLTASGTVYFSLAAGNDGRDASSSSPAGVNGPNIYTISAMDINDNFASFSNYGSAVDYCAPGVGIKSTWKDGGYRTISGTSMAAPHVAGLRLLGNIQTDGTVNGDPDGNADPIAVK